MKVTIIKDSISRAELRKMASEQYGTLVKAVVDVEKGIMALGGELHADEETALIEKENSNREYTWGINLYPDKKEDEWIEFDSVINIKPALGNRSRDIKDPGVREKVKEVVKKLVSSQ